MKDDLIYDDEFKYCNTGFPENAGKTQAENDAYSGSKTITTHYILRTKKSGESRRRENTHLVLATGSQQIPMVCPGNTSLTRCPN